METTIAAHGVTDVLPSLQFHIPVTNLFSNAMHLLKLIVVAYAKMTSYVCDDCLIYSSPLYLNENFRKCRLNCK